MKGRAAALAARHPFPSQADAGILGPDRVLVTGARAGQRPIFDNMVDATIRTIQKEGVWKLYSGMWPWLGNVQRRRRTEMRVAQLWRVLGGLKAPCCCLSMYLPICIVATCCSRAQIMLSSRRATMSCVPISCLLAACVYNTSLLL